LLRRQQQFRVASLHAPRLLPPVKIYLPPLFFRLVEMRAIFEPFQA
jgi:hypothetical protein